ncbi:LysR substrate-binding domain-containing protein [Vreelandella boliviensis]|uniref:LysR substrate-binding domain-containing protein n=1 Tax=Vreelandella boliviensis TaxID=223527 RepID=UPI001B8B6095|nr:LysR substrate-binding domain-containing protein [Halomonas boliviensis]MBS3669972.1 LysR family transcriptional regulator [Halomonas boliviensis]
MLNSLQVFVKVAEAENFSDAGRLLGLSASAISKQIGRIEDELGAQLFYRSTRSISLTPQGRMFLARCRRILGEFDSAQAELSNASHTPSGRLRVSMPAVQSLLVPVMDGFMRDYPNIQLELDFSDRLVDIINENFDVVIRTGEPEDSRINARRLGGYKMCLVASPEYINRSGLPRRLVDLKEHACIHYRFPSTGKLERWPLIHSDGDLGLVLPATIICNSTEARLELVLRGHGIACLPDFVVRQPLAAGRLKSLLEGNVRGEGVYQVMWQESRYPLARVRVLINYLVTHMFSAV